jgi:hypothetical protein
VRRLVLLIMRLLLARVRTAGTFVQSQPRPLRYGVPLSAMLSPFRLRFTINLRQQSASPSD